MADALKENKFAGELIRKSQIPRFYVEKYRVNNLYRYSRLKVFVHAILLLKSVLAF
jgi:hypothetical protein